MPGADLPGLLYIRDRHSGEALRGLAEAGGRTLVVNGVVGGSRAQPNLALAESAAAKIDEGGVATDAELHTSDAAIWAAGDIAYAHKPAADLHLRVEHWSEAEAMGEIVGEPRRRASALGRRSRILVNHR
jgi:NAD(P)H-nitrite reductase large subunit